MLSNANAVVSGRTDVMLFFQIILSPFTGLVQWSWRLSEVGSSSVNPEAGTGLRLGVRGVLFPRGNYFRLRRYKDEMFLYCKLSLRDVRAVMRTPGPSISLHTAGALTDVISLSPLSEKNKIFTF